METCDRVEHTQITILHTSTEANGMKLVNARRQNQSYMNTLLYITLAETAKQAVLGMRLLMTSC